MKKTLHIDRNGKIVIQDGNKEDVSINTNDGNEILNILNQVDDGILDALAQLADKLGGNALFETLINSIITQKNIVKGSITNIKGNVHVGDIIQINYVSKEKSPKELTLNMPLLREEHVVGRGKDLEDLEERLFNNKQVVLVNGMGGIGKTTLAQVYASKFYDKYEHIAWISKLTDDFINDFINADGLIDRFNIDITGKPSKQILNELLMEFKKLKSTCLLIIDDANEDLVKYHSLLPNQPDWHILVTSRVDIYGFDSKNLGFLSEEDSLKLFRKHYRLKNINDNTIKDIVKRLEYHTLSIEILAKTAESIRASPGELMVAIENNLHTHARTRHSQGEVIDRVTDYLCSVFEVSSLNDEEKWVLQNFCCLPLEFQPFDKLEDLLDSERKRDELLSKTLFLLREKGWLLYNELSDSYKIHKVIQEVVQKLLSIDGATVNVLCNSLIKKLSLDEDSENPIDKFPWIAYGQQFVSIAASIEDGYIIGLYNNLGLRLQNFGDLGIAKINLLKAYEISKKNYGVEHHETVKCASNLGIVLRDCGEYSEAKKMLFHTMQFNEKYLGYENPITAISYSNLALVLQDLNDLKGAKDYMLKAIKVDEKVFGINHPSTNKKYSNLASVHQSLGEYEEAKKLMEKSLKSAIHEFGEEHPTIAARYSNLATVLMDIGEYEEAKELLLKSIRIDEKNLGREHFHTAIGYSNLGKALKHLKDFKGAIGFFEKSHRIFLKSLGGKHKNTIVVKESIEYLKTLIKN